MHQPSRRALLGAGLAAAAGGLAAGGFGLIEAGVLPGKYRLARLLGECGTAPPAPAGPLPDSSVQRFWSRHRRRLVTVVTLLPAGTPAGTPLPVVVALHGLGGDGRAAARLYGPAMAAAGIRRCCVLCPDGDGTYWHRRAGGDDPQAMITDEVLPRAAARGLDITRIGLCGYSMGGYGALLLAERLGPRRIAGAAASSPAIFPSYTAARAADPGAFDGPADFARNDVLAGAAALRGVPCLITCGDLDPLAAISERFATRLGQAAGPPPAGVIQSGCHDEAFWARAAPLQLRFLRRALSGGEAG